MDITNALPLTISALLLTISCLFTLIISLLIIAPHAIQLRRIALHLEPLLYHRQTVLPQLKPLTGLRTYDTIWNWNGANQNEKRCKYYNESPKTR